MLKKGELIFAVLFLCLFLVGTKKPAAQEESTLYQIEKTRERKATEYIFSLSSVPEYKVETSGQRVDAIFYETRVADTFDKLEASGNLVRTLVAEKGRRTIVSLVLRRPPDDVEYSTSSGNEPGLRLRVARPQKPRDRPAIAPEIGDSLHIDRDRGVLIRRRISSPYSGNWRAFFRDFERPIRIDPELRYTLPSFPGFVLSRDEKLLPEKMFRMAELGRWDRAGAALSTNATEDGSGRKRLLSDFVQAEILLHQGEVAWARDILLRISEPRSAHYASALTFLRAYASAVAGNPHLAHERALELEPLDNVPRKWKPQARLLRIETALGAGHAEEAYAIASEEPEKGSNSTDLLALRKAQAGFAVGKKEEAIQGLNRLPNGLLEEHPRAMALLARYSYENEEYTKALKYYSKLEDLLSNREKLAMAKFGAAMANLRRGAPIVAREGLRKVREEYPGTPAEWRARMELADLGVLNGNESGKALAEKYKRIARGSDMRCIREEAAFKRILVAELSDHSFTAVKWLGPFLRDYFAGELAPQARALLVETLPEVVQDLMDKEAHIEALALVQRHRDTLRRARLSLDFLFELGEAFSDFGFTNRAVRVYRYMMSMQGHPEERQRVYPRLITSYLDQEEFGTARRYARKYLEEYPDGDYRRRIYYLLVQALNKEGSTQKAAELLRSPERPVSRELDVMAGKVLFSLQEYNEAQRYLARATEPMWRMAASDVLLLRAESLYRTGNRAQARPMYATLRERGYQKELASYRMGQIAMDNGREQEGAKLWREIVDTKKSPLWDTLAGEGLAMHDMERSID